MRAGDLQMGERAKHEVLGDHPKPANGYHLKTGQRE